MTEQEKLGQAIVDMKKHFPELTASQRADKIQQMSGLLPTHYSNGNGNGKASRR